MHLETNSLIDNVLVIELAIMHVCKHTQVVFIYWHRISFSIGCTLTPSHAGQCLERSNSPSLLLFWALWQRQGTSRVSSLGKIRVGGQSSRILDGGHCGRMWIRYATDVTKGTWQKCQQKTLAKWNDNKCHPTEAQSIWLPGLCASWYKNAVLYLTRKNE